MSLKIKVFSDSHGYLPEIKDKFDLLLIAGDITPAAWKYQDKKLQLEWIKNEFKEWLNSLPFKNANSKVFLVPGNHDEVFEKMSDSDKLILKNDLGYRFELLIHEEKDFEYTQNKEVKKLRIFGTPYCKKFGTWAFMKSETFLKNAFSEIPENLDILVTHDPPTLNKMGTITQGWQYGKDAGNEILSKHILRAKPKYVFSGHIHSGNHNFEEYEGIKMANVAYVDESYTPAFKILTFNI